MTLDHHAMGDNELGFDDPFSLLIYVYMPAKLT
jgi:hypothetical protein